MFNCLTAFLSTYNKGVFNKFGELITLRSPELKWILCIILFQLFIDLIFIELEPNI